MPHAADNPESNSILPQPELNPLVNPVLGANMGRWAEVYFTSPPEKREEAVLELLRELEGEAPAKNEATRAKPEPGQGVRKQTELAPPNRSAAANEKPQVLALRKESTVDTTEQSITCRSCGRTNPARHRFCGMCGADMQQTQTHDSPIVDPEQDEVNGWRIEDPAGDQAAEPTFVGFSQSDRNPLGLNWASDEGPKLLPYSEPVPYRYRIYIGAGLAILVSALVYTAWRGTNAGFGISHSLPPPAPAASPEAAAPAQMNPGPKADTPDTARTASHNASQTAAPAPAAGSSTKGAGKADTMARSNSEAPTVPSAVRGNGAQELTIAETYLSGTQGKAQDSTEAAKWLWKSVAKQNPEAALMLSDLYLRGKGVTKSCDQARLLLDAAARKGVSGAAERLRSLPAFGCQ